MIPKELTDLLEIYKDDDETLFYVVKAEMTDNELTFVFSLTIPNINDLGPVSQRWFVRTAGYRTGRISFDYSDSLNLFTDHPLLLDYTDSQCELFYTGVVKDPARVFQDLYATHKRLYGDLRPFPFFLGEGTAFFNPFQYSNGSLIMGSKKVLTEYGQCLRENGVDYSLLCDRESGYENGSEYLTESKNLGLLIMRNTYIIAEEFHFEKISDR